MVKADPIRHVKDLLIALFKYPLYRLCTSRSVRLHSLVFDRGQFSGLQQNAIGNRHFADIVYGGDVVDGVYEGRVNHRSVVRVIRPVSGSRCGPFDHFSDRT